MSWPRLIETPEGNCACEKCGGERFRSDETLFGYVRCVKCEQLYSHPAIPEISADELLESSRT